MSSDLTIVLLSLRVAVAAMLMALPIAFGLAWILVRKQLRGRFLIEAIVSLPLALPPVVIGYGLLILLGAIGGTVFLATWDIPPPTVAVKKTINDDHFPR